MIQLYDLATDQPCGTITEQQLRFIVAELEEESREDTNYYLNQATLDMFEAEGADPALVTVLRAALAGREDMDIRWERS